jgi:hypothetical protein
LALPPERMHRSLLRSLRTAWAVLVLCTAAARIGRAQDAVIDRLPLDKLQLVSLGAGAGPIFPSQVEATNVYFMSSDYGEITPNWHVIFGVNYWESRYRDAVVAAFVDTLTKSLNDPTGQAKIVASRISLYDVAFNVEARYMRNSSADLKPFWGVGLSANVINADGDLINGTFVERALDTISPGIFVDAGFALKVFKHFGIEASGRADLLSGFRSTQFRGGATYFFGHVRGSGPQGAGTR